MSEGTQVSRAVTHRGEKFKENHKKVASENYQEIYGSTLDNLIQKARDTVRAQETSVFRR